MKIWPFRLTFEAALYSAALDFIARNDLWSRADITTPRADGQFSVLFDVEKDARSCQFDLLRAV